MSLLSLKGIGKIYASESSVAVGLRGIDLDFDIGEFVAVTGKSGSGKTTLLNVISGMDTYEEGELYVEGEPTSHYEQKDWELYRNKYISFIFQDYNIIESFTVLQNVELALSYIDSPKERRAKALELVERVGLSKSKNHKGSKLSGGQKQRTVIARALAKDSPIILADEPTGNLDAKSSEEIIALLAEISKNKLVIIVTHSASELEQYATREIRIFDGAVERDEILREAEKPTDCEISEPEQKTHIFRRGAELGIHRFKAMPKLSVFMCMLMVLAILGTFFATISNTMPLSTTDINAFSHRDGRVVISRRDGKLMSEEELQKLTEEMGAEKYVHYDYLYDIPFSHRKNYADETRRYAYAELYAYIDDGSYSCDIGDMASDDDEVMLILPLEWKNIYGNKLNGDETVKFGGGEFKISGIDYFYDNTKQAKAIFTEEGFEKTTKTIFINGYRYGGVFAEMTTLEDLLPQDLRYVKIDGVYVDPTLNGDDIYIKSQNHKIVSAAKTLLNTGLDFDFTWSKVSSNGSMQQRYSYDLSGMKIIADKCEVTVASDDDYYGDYYYEENGIFGEEIYYEDVKVPSSNSMDIYVSEVTLEKILQNLRDPNYYQASLFFKNDTAADKSISELREDGYYAVTSDHTVSNNGEKILMAFIAVFTVGGWLITLLFLSLFLYICSARAIVAKRGDIAIMRSMGIEVKVIKMSMYVYTALTMIPSFIVLAVAAIVVYTLPKLNPLFPFLHAWQYAMIVLGMILINLYISTKYNKKMFKDSVRKTLRGGAKE